MSMAQTGASPWTPCSHENFVRLAGAIDSHPQPRVRVRCRRYCMQGRSDCSHLCATKRTIEHLSLGVLLKGE